MVKCENCGYENSDGSNFCVNCHKMLAKVYTASPEYEQFIKKTNEREEAAEQAKKKSLVVLGCIVVVIFVCIGFFLFRVQSAPGRAEQLVIKCIESSVGGSVDVVFDMNIGSCLKATEESYFSGEGFDMYGYINLGNNILQFSANVSMKGIFDEGEVTSVEISGVEIIR